MSEETRKEKPQSAPPRPTANSKPVQKVIYLGPAMIEDGFQINYGTVFSNGLPEEVKKRAADDKEFAKMLVPVGDAPKAMRELMNRDSDLFSAKRKISKEYIERKGKKRGK